VPRRSFFLGSQHVLASTARDGQLIVWHVSEGGDATLTGQQALALQLPAAEGGASARLAWHPSCQDVLFFTAGARVLAAHISELTASAQQVSRTALHFCLHRRHTLRDRLQAIAATCPGVYRCRAWVHIYAIRMDFCPCAQVDVDINALPPGLVCLPPGSNKAALTSIAVSGDGTLLAVGSPDGCVSCLFFADLDRPTFLLAVCELALVAEAVVLIL